MVCKTDPTDQISTHELETAVRTIDMPENIQEAAIEILADIRTAPSASTLASSTQFANGFTLGLDRADAEEVVVGELQDIFLDAYRDRSTELVDTDSVDPTVKPK
jgi:hypothetical protein